MNRDYADLTPQEFQSFRKDNEHVLLDVREGREFEAGHIPGSFNFPSTIIESDIEKKLPDKEAVYVLYCYSGKRSTYAANIMASLGYKNLYTISGGITSWPFEIEK